MDRPNYITPAGYAALRAEYDALFGGERPALVETIAWAAGNGDRSENGDYIYGRKRLREIDRRLGWLSKRMKAARIVDPAAQQDRDRIWFGATVILAGEDDAEQSLTLVGDDESDAGVRRIGWNSPFARALRGAAVGDVRRVALPAGERDYEVLAIEYPAATGNGGQGSSIGDGRRKLMSDDRTETAREHDDRELIEGQDAAPDAVASTAGGAIARDVGSADELGAIDDPDGTARATKQGDIDAGVAEPSNRARGGDAAGLSQD